MSPKGSLLKSPLSPAIITFLLYLSTKLIVKIFKSLNNCASSIPIISNEHAEINISLSLCVFIDVILAESRLVNCKVGLCVEKNSPSLVSRSSRPEFIYNTFNPSSAYIVKRLISSVVFAEYIGPIIKSIPFSIFLYFYIYVFKKI